MRLPRSWNHGYNPHSPWGRYISPQKNKVRNPSPSPTVSMLGVVIIVMIAIIMIIAITVIIAIIMIMCGIPWLKVGPRSLKTTVWGLGTDPSQRGVKYGGYFTHRTRAWLKIVGSTAYLRLKLSVALCPVLHEPTAD